MTLNNPYAMNSEEFNNFVRITTELTCKSTRSLTFQNYVEERLNAIDYNEFLRASNQGERPRFYIRLKNPERKNTNERGLKVCLFNDNLFEEKVVSPGTTIIKFAPMLKVIGFTNDNCSECGKHLIDIGDKGKEESENKHQVENGLTQAKEFVKNEGIVKCKNCNFRVFCCQECKLKAMLDWHDLECDFIAHIQKELITTNNGIKVDTETDQAIEKIILIIITTFRLLISLVRNDEKLFEIVINMSDHLKLYQKYVEKGEVDSPEHEAIFRETQHTFGPLIASYFEEKKNQIKQAQVKPIELGQISKDGICRALFLVFVNVSSVMDHFNNNLGLMFDPIFSMINHSCDPNCTLIWRDDGEILIKSVKRLRASNEILLNYIPVHLPREMRKKMLRNSFFFDCECLKCTVSDKDYDAMLPINCLFCNHNNRGFVLENFEKFESVPDIGKKKMCNNCENIIDVDEIFQNYLDIFRFFRSLNKEAEKLQDFCSWTLESENVMNMDTQTFRNGVKLLQKSYEIVPLKSWPMITLLNVVKIGFQFRDPFDIKVLRMTYLTNFLTENMLESEYRLKVDIGASLYDLSVVSADYLFDQYLRYKEELDEEILDAVGKGSFSLCILSYKHLQERFSDSNDSESEKSMERSQKDMVQLALEIRRLLEHFERRKRGEKNRKGSKASNRNNSTVSSQNKNLVLRSTATAGAENGNYFDNYTQKVFEESIINYERYMECGAATQFKPILLSLTTPDYKTFSLKVPRSLGSKNGLDKGVGKGSGTCVKTDQELIGESKVAGSPSPFVARPTWVAQLWS